MSLQGRTILLTRDPGQSAQFESEVVRRGGRVVCVPMIAITDPDSWSACDDALEKIDHYDALLFTSINGVEKFLARSEIRSGARETLGRKVIYAVGERTKAELEMHGLRVVMMPEIFSAASLAKTLAAADVRGRRFLHPCGNLRRPEIGDRIAELGGVLNEVVVYKTEGPAHGAFASLAPLLKPGTLDVITFASPSAVKNFAELVGPARPPARIAVIGRTTAQTTEELGWHSDIIAGEATMSGMLEAIDSFFD